MDKIKVSKRSLVTTLEKNKLAHRTEFEEVLEHYREFVIAELEIAVERARKGDTVYRSVRIPEPMDHTEDYERVLAMMQWELNDEVYLTEEQFRHFIQDDWGWKRDVLSVNRRMPQGCEYPERWSAYPDDHPQYKK